LTQAIPLGSSLKLTGAGNVTLFLQQNTGSTVSANVCIGLYVVPGGVLTGTLVPIGATFTNQLNVTSGAPMPVTLDYDLGLGALGYTVSGTTGTDVEVVATVQASSAVSIVSSPSTGLNDQATIDTSS
jgi:hypothetical protein